MPRSSREASTTLRKLHHDMRTPLGQILGYAEMLEEDAQDTGQSALLPDIGKIQQAARELLRIVDGVFRHEEAATASPGGHVDSTGPQQRTDRRDTIARLEGTQVLVVDDDPANRELLTRLLAPHGPRVTAVADGREALHQIESGDFDLVLLDLLMPEMDGLEVLEALRRTRSAAELPVIMVTSLESREDVVAALRAGANDYVTKPVDLPVVLARMEAHISLRRANLESASLARELAIRNGFIRRIFGRYVSDDIVDSLLENPEGLELGGERRTVAVLICDLRGFSLLAESLEPLELVWLLNQYLGTMADTIHAHRGTIDEFVGDSVLAFFGAPISSDGDAERAVACAQAMQAAMAKVNRAIRERGLPEISMGVGIATGEVVVGSVGSERRSKYTAVGSTVNLAARIESFTLGGEIWICDTTRNALSSGANIEAEREVHPKGFERPLLTHRVRSDAPEASETSRGEEAWVRLSPPKSVFVQQLDGKSVQSETRSARLLAVRAQEIELELDFPIRALDELLIRVGKGEGSPSGFARVMSASAERARAVFSSPSPALRDWLAATQQP
jgi:class 3 adenylate cyclase